MTQAATTDTRRRPPVRRLLVVQLLVFFSVLGPGIITANMGNDAGGISTYSLAGARFGYELLWALIPITIALAVVMEMSARMGTVTGKGLSDLIRENFGVRTTVLVVGVVLAANFGTTLAEFSGLAAAGEVFGVPKYASVVLGAVFVWVLVVRASYRFVERIFLVASAVFFAYIASGIMAGPDWGDVARHTAQPTLHFRADYLTMLIGLVGTTLAPWELFYLQSSIAEKGVRQEHYRYARLDVFLGLAMAMVVSFFIIVACGATIFHNGADIKDAKDAAEALKPLAGPAASVLFAFGLINASLVSASVLPVATSYYVCEALGFEAGVGRSPREAPVFYGLYTLIIVAAALAAMTPVPLFEIMYLSQVALGVLLPFVLIFMLLLINRRSLMGPHVNGPVFNAIAWLTVGVMILMTLALILTPLIG